MIHGRGAGIPTNFYFPLVIEPQKDIVMIITTRDKVSTIRERIFSDLELGKPGTVFYSRSRLAEQVAQRKRIRESKKVCHESAV